jgi:hypothetical protein
MPLTEAKKNNIKTTNESNFYRGTKVEVREKLLMEWEMKWIILADENDSARRYEPLIEKGYARHV